MPTYRVLKHELKLTEYILEAPDGEDAVEAVKGNRVGDELELRNEIDYEVEEVG